MGDKDDFFGMSDDDFLKGSPPPSSGSDTGASASATAEPEVVEEPVQTEEEDADKVADPAAVAEPVAGDAELSPEDQAAKDAEAKAAEEAASKPDEEILNGKPPAPKASEEAGKDGKPVVPDPKKDASQAEQVAPAAIRTSKEMKSEELADFYDSLIGKPIKANGKDIILKNPEEVLRLVQMGAGYGKKIHAMQPHLKTIRMLENNNLLDTDKLSFLIDLDKKNPEAIKRLIKESGIDPLDINLEDNADYRPTNHGVSDTEVTFAETLKEVAELPGGRETIQLINTTWDHTSREALWAQPELLTIFQSQRENGLWDQITAEMDRMKVLGDIKPNTPFIDAYKMAGDALVQANSLQMPGTVSTQTPKPVAPTTPAQGGSDQQHGRVLATRAAAPKSSATNNDKAKAAASPSSVSRKAKEVINPLDMPDDEFLKLL